MLQRFLALTGCESSTLMFALVPKADQCCVPSPGSNDPLRTISAWRHPSIAIPMSSKNSPHNVGEMPCSIFAASTFTVSAAAEPARAQRTAVRLRNAELFILSPFLSFQA